MGGIFGGLLLFTQMIGGLFLFLLVGSKAWNKTERAETWRTEMGGALIGLLGGIGVYFFVLSETAKRSAPIEVCIFTGLIAGLILAFGLLLLDESLQ